MPLHASFNAFLSLPARGLDDIRCEECLEKQNHDRDHERTADEFS
jgi:hypothetical protein